MPKELGHINQLIDESRLIKDEDKEAYKKRIKNLSTEKLDRVREHLESEKYILLQTMNKVVEKHVTNNPESPLIEKMKDFFCRIDHSND